MTRSLGNLYQQEKTDKIRSSVFAFFLFEIAMLFQTSFMNLGTIVAGFLSALVVITYLFDCKRIRIRVKFLPIILYTVLLFAVSIATSSLSSKLFQVALYVVLFILLSDFNLTAREKKLLLYGFVISSVVYSMLIIYSRFLLSSAYIHSKIVLFGTELDPNYVGLPLIVSFSILFYDFLNNRKKLFKIIALFILLFAVLLTSSRGNFISLCLCILGNVFYYIVSNKSPLHKKTIVVIFAAILLLFFFFFAYSKYSSYLERLISFESDNIDNGRFELWEEAFNIWQNHPIFGYGFECLGRIAGKGVHNTYIQLLCDTGFVGFVLFGFFLVSLIRKIFLSDKCLFIAFIGILCHSFFLGAISTRCFWVALITISMLLPKGYSRIAKNIN